MNCTKSKLFSLTFCCLFLVFFFSLPTHSAAAGSDTWEFHLAPYAWLAGQNGTVATLPGLPPADIDFDFWDDIFENINGALFLVGEASKDQFGFYMELTYVNIESEESTLAPYFSSLVSETESWMVTAAGQYRLVEKPNAFLNVLAGIRYWSVDSTLTLHSELLPGRGVSHTDSWVDPVVGLRGLSSLGESNFIVSVGLGIGGFGMGSDFMWDVSVNLGYRWTETFSTTLGYRYLDVDYEEDGFLYDVAQYGPILGLSWRF